MIFKPHWTFHYVSHRTLAALDQIFHWGTPWLPKPARKWLERNLKRDMKGIEWGSGLSSIWLSKRVKELISVEDNEAWYNLVSKKLSKKGSNNVRYYLVASNEQAKLLRNQDHNAHKERYVFVERNLMLDSLDFAFVDGCFREDCILRGIELLKPGGYLILDDSNCYLPTVTPLPIRCKRPNGKVWLSIEEKLSQWACHKLSDGVKETSIWIKPNEHDLYHIV